MRVVLDGTRVHEGARAVEEAEPPDVERPEVEAGAAFQNPLGHAGARPAAGGDAVEEAAGDDEVAALRRLAHDERAVGRLGARSVDPLTHTPGVPADRTHDREGKSVPVRLD